MSIPQVKSSEQLNKILGPAPSASDDGKYLKYDDTSKSYVLDTPEGGMSGGSFHSAHVYNTSAQSVARITGVPLSFDSERWDTDGFHDNGVNNTRFTIPEGMDGYYMVGGGVTWESLSSTSKVLLYIAKNGVAGDIRLVGNEVPRNPVIRRLSLSTLAYLEAGDYVELVLYQDSASSLTTTVETQASPEFWILKVG